MSLPTAAPSSPHPLTVVLKLVAIVFVVEVGVMFLLPVVLPAGTNPVVSAFVDSCLLTVFTAPLLWLVVIGPVRAGAAAEKAAAVAQIATGVAHELRNPLTSIKMLVQSHRETETVHGQLDEDLEIIEDEIRRMERSIQTFLEFARPRQPERRAVDLHDIVQRVFSLVKPRAVRQRVELCLECDAGNAVVDGDWEMLLQLILNLVLNSLDMMSEGGRICVSLRSVSRDQVELAVEDTGPGVSPDVERTLFEPFVTNKEAGVGLGLVICRRVAAAHRGSLTCENVPSGARFTLVLPATSRAA